MTLSSIICQFWGQKSYCTGFSKWWWGPSKYSAWGRSSNYKRGAKLARFLIEFTITYTLCCKFLGSFAFLWCKMAMFWRAGMREGGKPLPLVFQYLIFMLWRACDLSLVMISLLASKWQDFRYRAFQFHFIKQLKNGHSNFKDLLFWSQWRYHDQI